MHYEFNQGDKTNSNKKRDCDVLNATFLQQVNNKQISSRGREREWSFVTSV